MKKYLTVISLILLSLFLLSFSPRQATPLSFAWAFISLGDNGEAAAIDCSPPVIPMRTGDRVKLYVKPIDNAFVYVFLVDTENRLHLLFPESLGFFETGYTFGNQYIIPEGATWFGLDEPEGTEYFYLIGSPERLSGLERLTDAYISLCDKTGPDDPEKRDAAQDEVLGEIRSIQKGASPLAEGSETPVPISGSFRTIEEVAGNPAVLVQSEDVYVRTIRIRH
jgi:hypothetical protein